MGAVTSYQQTKIAKPIDLTKPAWDRLIWLESRVEHHHSVGPAIPDTHAPTANERETFEGRRSQLLNSLRPADKSQIVLAISQMFSAWPSARYDLETTKRMGAAYVSAVEQFPMWAINAGILHLVKTGGSFAPSAPEVAQAVQREVAPVNVELARIAKVLDAQIFHVPDATEKERIEAGFRDLVERLAMNAPVDVLAGKKQKTHAQLKAEAEKAVAEMAANPIDLPQMSDRLREKIEAGRAQG